MGRIARIWMLAAALSLAGGVPGISAQALVKVTVQDLFNSNHQIVVGPGTEVVWADPHFERVWFPAGSGIPQLQRGREGYRAVFTMPGRYRDGSRIERHLPHDGHSTRDEVRGDGSPEIAVGRRMGG